jgi:hypothetical protein
MTGAATAGAAVPTPAAPAAFRNLRRLMLAITADLLEGFGAKRVKKHSEPSAGSRRGYRKYPISRFHLP